MEPLKECPFCGSNDITKSEDYYCREIYLCTNCQSKALIDVWNTRHSPWISVKDKLPLKDSVKFLIVDKNGDMFVAEHWKVNLRSYWLNTSFNRKRNIYLSPTHYMPLPQSPKETE